MANRYLIVSDLHVCDIEDHDDGWKRHKSSAWLYDDAFDAMVADFVARSSPDDALTLILNGDIFDFDLVTAVPDDPPWPVRRIERLYGLDATEAKSAWKLERILADHPIFLRTIARFAAAGRDVVFVMGNHDRELWFEGVQRVLRDAIAAAGRAAGVDVPASRVAIEPWFYYVRGEVYVEHGHQYDYYSAFRYNLAPTMQLRGEVHLALPMGNLSNRYLLSNMGTFNPHATDFILSAWGYLSHWVRHYLLARRPLVLTWLIGSFRALFALIGTRRRLRAHPPEDYDARKDAVADRFGLPRDVVRRLYDLRHEPITSRLFRVVREFWIDRLLLAAAMTLGTVALLLSGAPTSVKVVVPTLAFPLAWLLYQWIAGSDNALNVEFDSHRYAHAIATTLPTRVVVFGHTHVPNVIPLSRDVTFANSGTWAPIWRKDLVSLVAGLRNFVVVHVDGDTCRLRLGSWMALDRGPSAARSMAADRPRR